VFFCINTMCIATSVNLDYTIGSSQNKENLLDLQTNITIDEISDGLGLVITISNAGDIAATNLNLAIQTKGGVFLFPKEKNIELSELEPGGTIQYHIQVFGLGVGSVNEYPQISITLTNSGFQLKRIISAVVLGPFVKIVGINFDDSLSFIGYTIFSPEYSTETFLMNNSGSVVHSWDSAFVQGFGVFLLENSDMIRTGLQGVNPRFIGGGITGRVEIRDWNNTLQWEFIYSNDQHCLHHDIEILPNGNIIMIAWEYKSASEAIQAGRDPNALPTGELWPDHIIEVEPTGTTTGDIVWEWHVWDHLIQDFDPSKDNYGTVAEHPERLDINYGIYEGKDRADMNHINAVDYNPILDQIIVSAHNQNEIWVIDHSTTTEEASGHSGGRYGRGGDLLYRWGNPEVYHAGTSGDQQLFGQHDAQWIDEGLPGGGHILVFNNGQGRPEGKFSSIDEIIPPVNESGFYNVTSGSAFGPAEPVWVYMADEPGEFYAGHLSGCQRLPNGNTLICNGPGGFFFEVTMDKSIVWQYLNTYPNIPRNHVTNILRYAPDYPGLRFLDK
ncbi:MAG: aryl-sulfate sulfotransferase, partial [Candidatus Thermoplasmatota archaeon]|nr:aryl-sulfate sulfotransferase [Candidatus Thermoplasmatota archaeon]MBU1940845.1 aryl-sulfate sulfotransferase [Candidatus Thermoplasmatota archaeon]